MNSPFKTLVKKCTQSGDSRHYVNVLNTGDDALLARIHLIRSAQSSVLIQTYIWKNDATGRLFLDELAVAARRGVHVKLLIDPWASEKKPAWVAGVNAVHPNLELKYYNPSSNDIHPSVPEMFGDMVLHFKQVNQRMHNKLFIVDGLVGIVGGRNYQNDYYDRGVTRNFKDRDVLVIGPSVGDMVDSFNEYWNYPLSVYAKDLKDVQEAIRRDDLGFRPRADDAPLEPQFTLMSGRADNADFIFDHFIGRSLMAADVRFVADTPGKNDSPTLAGGGVVFDEFVRFMKNIKNTAVAQTPYLVLDPRFFGDIKNLRKANPGLNIIISTNSLASTDNIYTYSYARKMRRSYVKDLLFRIFEFKSIPQDYGTMTGYPGAHNVPLCVHAKTFVIDDTAVWIGSLNVDPRSYNLNTEVAVIIRDRAVVQSVKENIMADIAPQNSWTVGRCEKLPWFEYATGFLGFLIRYTPVKWVWPYRYTENFVLKKGKEPVPFYDRRFYDHYQSAGPYPGMNVSVKEAEVMLLKAFIEILKPLL